MCESALRVPYHRLCPQLGLTSKQTVALSQGGSKQMSCSNTLKITHGLIFLQFNVHFLIGGGVIKMFNHTLLISKYGMAMKIKTGSFKYDRNKTNNISL
jgi:hypothetical protein